MAAYDLQLTISELKHKIFGTRAAVDALHPELLAAVTDRSGQPGGHEAHALPEALRVRFGVARYEHACAPKFARDSLQLVGEPPALAGAPLAVFDGERRDVQVLGTFAARVDDGDSDTCAVVARLLLSDVNAVNNGCVPRFEPEESRQVPA